MFPYSGYNPKTLVGKRRENILWKVIETCRDLEATENRPPIVILNRDTENKKKAQSFLTDPRIKKNGISIRRTWSVDTCQMWLSGWGKVLDTDNIKDSDRIVQIPGDLDMVSEGEDDHDFFNKLGTFMDIRSWDIVVGDFTSGDTFNAKELIDLYGTFALMANWFPEIAQNIRQLPLKKPRSEFLNIRVKTLKELLDHRKFAYEQTLNMLIRSWDSEKKDWKYKIKAESLGMLKDDSTFRQYRDCLDQIERTERMLKLLWREINDIDEKILVTNPQGYKEKYQSYIDLYDRLDRRSTSIRENARIIIRNILGLGPK
jgi:hypothetical protein